VCMELVSHRWTGQKIPPRLSCSGDFTSIATKTFHAHSPRSRSSCSERPRHLTQHVFHD
jgi:hypothetical protein